VQLRLLEAVDEAVVADVEAVAVVMLHRCL